MWRRSYLMGSECLPWLTAVIDPSSSPRVGSWLFDLEAYTISLEDIGPNACLINEGKMDAMSSGVLFLIVFHFLCKNALAMT